MLMMALVKSAAIRCGDLQPAGKSTHEIVLIFLRVCQSQVVLSGEFAVVPVIVCIAVQ